MVEVDDDEMYIELVDNDVLDNDINEDKVIIIVLELDEDEREKIDILHMHKRYEVGDEIDVKIILIELWDGTLDDELVDEVIVREFDDADMIIVDDDDVFELERLVYL